MCVHKILVTLYSAGMPRLPPPLSRIPAAPVTSCALPPCVPRAQGGHRCGACPEIPRKPCTRTHVSQSSCRGGGGYLMVGTDARMRVSSVIFLPSRGTLKSQRISTCTAANALSISHQGRQARMQRKHLTHHARVR